MSGKSIEDVINGVLRGDAQRNALDLIAFLRANEIPFKVSENFVDVHYQGKNVCSILMTGSDEAPGPWTIWSDQEPGSWITWPDGVDHTVCEGIAVDDHTKEVIWAHVNYCASCGGDCSPGKTKTVLGKSFDGLCSSAIAFTNPDAEALDCAKQMIVMRKNDILEAVLSTQ